MCWTARKRTIGQNASTTTWQRSLAAIQGSSLDSAALVLGTISDQSEISNSVGPCQILFRDTSPFTPASGLVRFFAGCASTTKARSYGSLLIFRSVSVRPKHLFDQNFDQDYLFKLPFRGSGMPIQVDGVLVHTISDFELSRVR